MYYHNISLSTNGDYEITIVGNIKIDNSKQESFADFLNAIVKDIAGNCSYNIPQKISKVIFNEPATIVLWEDGSKTVVKAQNGEKFDKEKGLALCIVKKLCDNKGNYNNIFKKWCQ